MKRERGAVLLLFVMLMVSGAVGGFLAWGPGEQRALARAADDAVVLARARDMVVGYGLTNPRRPGELPFPDRRTDGNDDGNGDCVATWDQLNGAHLLGHLPVYLEQGCGSERPAFGLALHDAGGERLWYAVARNLTYPKSMLNSAMADGWLRVYGAHGIVANDAAFIVFSPGLAIGTQQRSGSANPSAYLDSIDLGGMLHDNGDDDEQFVSAARSERFNDRLLAVSRAEFFDAITRRVAHTLFTGLEAYRHTHGAYPYAALPDGACSLGTPLGFYPLAIGDCMAVPSSPPAWFASDWSAVTRYTRVAPDVVQLRFEGCATVFTVSPLGLSPSAERCA